MKEFFSRKAMVNVIVFIVALVMIGTGIGLNYGSGISTREDLKLYNQAIAIYNEQDYDTTSSPAYPLDNLLEAITYFQNAVSASSDDELKSLALYNIGTAIGRDFIVFSETRSSELGLAMAIAYLQEAIRLDPTNEDAKYNLEYLEYYYSFYE